MQNKVKLKSHIKTVITISIVAVTMTVILVVSLGMYIVTSKSIKENVRVNTKLSVNQVNYDLEQYIKNVETIITGLQYSFSVEEFFDGTKDEYVNVSYVLRSLIKNRDDIINIFLIRPDGKIISNENKIKYKNIDFTEQDYYIGAINSTNLYISTSHVQNVFLKKHSWVVSCSKAVYDKNNLLKGVIVVDLNFQNIHNLIKQISLLERGYIFVVASDGSYVYHPKANLIYSGIVGENSDVVFSNKDDVISSKENGENVEHIVVSSNLTSWKTIGKVYANDFNVYLNKSKKYFIIFIFSAFIVAMILAYAISQNIVRPINKLVDGMLKFKNGDLDAKVEVTEKNEFGLLTDIFNSMTQKIKTLIETNKMVERNKRKSDFKLLQSQINPHFLYNTLDSIVWMGETGKNEEVVTMTSSLAKMFRLGLNRGEEYVTIAEEIEHINSYLTIQKMRYGDKLNYSISCDEDLKTYKIIKILLQPIVENAIYHGIKNIPNKGQIDIKIYKDKFDKIRLTNESKKDYSIYFEVEDNGPGISEENLQKIFDGKIKRDKKKKGSGIGVNNVNDRIKMYYGENYGLHIESELYEGTIVTIKLPFEQFDEGDYYE